MWEVFSNGATPYIAEFDILKFLKSGKRLEIPKDCPPVLYELMKECWQPRMQRF